MEKSRYIWFNGEFRAWDDATIHVLSHVAHYGTGVFEGIRAYARPEGSAILALDRHVQRFFRSCKIIGLPMSYSEEDVRDAILTTVRRNELEACYIRPLAFRGYGELGVLPTACPVDLAIATFPFAILHGTESLEQGITLGVSSWRRMAPDTHPAMAKATGNYLNSQMVIMEAKRHGYDEGVVLDSEGYVCECSGENIFVLLDGVLFTPEMGASILPGITRELAMQIAQSQGLEVRERRIPREMLYVADEIFVTGTAAEICPVRSVDGRTIGGGGRGEATAKIQAHFLGVTRGELPDTDHWLTPV